MSPPPAAPSKALPAGCARYVAGDPELQELAEFCAYTLLVQGYATYQRMADDLADLIAELPEGKSRRAWAIWGLCDRWALLVRLLRRPDLASHGERTGWLYDRCREVEIHTDGYLLLWARVHGKSSIITFGGIVQELLRDPEQTFGIFSHTRPIAKGFLRVIKREFETNDTLKDIYSDVLWADPANESGKWSEDDGIVIKRAGNPKESSVEAWGLVDGQPTGKHFTRLVYDDVVTRESVTTPEMVKKVTEAFELSQSLGTIGGREPWMIGTRYSFGDTYQTLMDRMSVKPRIYPATVDGTLTGRPVLLTQEAWDKVKVTQPTQVAAQYLQNPAAGNDKAFDARKLSAFEVRPLTMTVYILCDPSKGSPNRRSDRTAIAVIGLDSAGNRYLLDGYRHRMNLDERWQAIKTLRRHWMKAAGVQTVEVGYERYGMQSDLEAFEWRMRLENEHFQIVELATPKDHTASKKDRVERLVPDFARGRFHIPFVVTDAAGGLHTWYVDAGNVKYKPLAGDTRARKRAKESAMGDLIVGPIKRIDEDGKIYDLTRAFIEEYQYFPFGSHDDLIDAASRIYDIDAEPAAIINPRDLEPAEEREY